MLFILGAIILLTVTLGPWLWAIRAVVKDARDPGVPAPPETVKLSTQSLWRLQDWG